MDSCYQLSEAIGRKDYACFERLIEGGLDVSQMLFNKNTILHCMAHVDWELSVTQSVKSIFMPAATVINWISLVLRSMPDAVQMKEFFTIQNGMSQTCMHIAIINKNWVFARSLLDLLNINYYVYPDLYRRNQEGLTELELFLVLYGIKGQPDQLQRLFHKEECTIDDMKSTLKAFKIINLSQKKYAVLPCTHKFFKFATELEYPEPFSTIEDPLQLEQVYEENGLVDPSKEYRDMEERKLQYWLDRYSNNCSLSGSPDHIKCFLEAYAKEFLLLGQDTKYAISIIREFCKEEPYFPMNGICDDIINDLNRAYNSSGFSQYSQLISELIAKLSNLYADNR